MLGWTIVDPEWATFSWDGRTWKDEFELADDWRYWLCEYPEDPSEYKPAKGRDWNY